MPKTATAAANVNVIPVRECCLCGKVQKHDVCDRCMVSDPDDARTPDEWQELEDQWETERHMRYLLGEAA